MHYSIEANIDDMKDIRFKTRQKTAKRNVQTLTNLIIFINIQLFVLVVISLKKTGAKLK